MKKTFRFTFAALALAALASCSSDDLLDNGGSLLKQNRKSLTVEVEDMVDEMTTRVAWRPDGNGIANYWQTEDKIMVMDNTLTMYDVYQFNSDENAFIALEGDDAVKNPEIALFEPGIENFGWNYTTKGSEVTYEIPAQWSWAEDTEAAGEGTVAYLSNLPLWGTTDVTDGKLGVTLRYLTAILRVGLENVPGNATTFEMEAFEDINGNNPVQITGEFKATLATKGDIDEAAVLKATLEDGSASAKANKITIDLKDAKFEETYLFIPVIARQYGLWKFTVKDAESNVIWSKNVTERTANRGNITRLTVDAFLTAGGDIPALNRALEVQKDASEVTVETSKTTSVTAEENTIRIPAGMKASTITLDLAGLQGGTAANSKTLSIVAEDDYEGELIVKLQDDATVTNITNVYVNLPKAKVSFAGNWQAGTTKIALGKANIANSLIVKSLTIAADAVVGNIYPNAASCDGNADEADILVAEGASVATLQLPNNTKIDAVTINGTVTTVNAAVANDLSNETIEIDVTLGKTASVTTLSTNQKKITVPTGAKITTLNSYNGAAITIQGTFNSNGKLNAYNGGTVSVSGTVVTLNADNQSLQINEEDTPQVTSLSITGSGVITTANVRGANVTIGRTATGDAIKTLLNMGENKKLTLTGGYIKKLTGAKNLQFANTEKAGVATGIAEIEDVTLAEKYVSYTSTWGGALPSTTYALVKNSSDNNNNEIWTASQFANYDGKTAAKLIADIDLNHNPFTPKANISAVLDGNYKTISNVSITSAKAAGLFLSLAANGEVKNLLINGIGINQTTTGTTVNTTYAVGTLAAKATGGKVTNVNVKYATLTNAHWVVGGLIGEIAGDVTIDGTKKANELGDENTYSTVAVTITGKNMLGGLVGQITSGEVEIKNYKSNATFTVTETLSSNNRKNFGTVAPFVGTAKAGQLTATTGLSVENELKYADKKLMGFTNNLDVDSDMNTYYFAGRKELGFVNGESFTLILKGTTQITTIKSDVKTASSVASANAVNVYLLDSAYSD